MPRRLALISYHFDNDTEIGARRARLFAQMLPSHGWLPTVIAAGNPTQDVVGPTLVVRHVPVASMTTRLKGTLGVDDERVRRIRGGQANHVLLSRLTLAAASVADLFPETLAWSRRALHVARSETRARPISAVLSTSPPHTTHLAARALASELRVPWIAELRDLWSQNADRNARRLRRISDRLVEPAILRRAAVLVTVSQPLADRLSRLHPGARVQSIPSGFDATLLADPGGPISPRFKLVYTGRIYPGYQHLRSVLQPLHMVIEDGRVSAGETDLDLLLVGPLDAGDVGLIDRLGLSDVVHVLPPVSNAEAVDRQRQAQILVHLRWDDPGEPGVTTGKLAEYLAARRPILSTGRFVDEVVRILATTNAGIATFTEDETANVIAESYAAFKKAGRVPYLGDPEAVALFDASAMVRAMAGLLDEIAGSTVPR